MAYKLRKYARRNRVMLLTTGAVMASLLVGVSAATWQAVRATKLQKSEQEKAAAVTAVLDFLVEDVFSQANPNIQQKRDVSLVEVLNDLSAVTSERFPKSPLAEASIRHYLGVICRNVGLYEESDMHLKRALQIRCKRLGEEHIDTARTKFEFAAATWNAGSRYGNTLQAREKAYKEADRLGAEALDTFKRLLGERHPETLYAMVVLAEIKHFMGQQDQAMLLCRDARRLGVSNTELNSNDLSDKRNSTWLIIQRHQLGKNRELDTYVKDNYRRVCSELPELHPHRLFWTTWYGIMLMRQGKIDEATSHVEMAYKKRLGLLGKTNVYTWLGGRTLAGLYFRQGRQNEAIALLETGRQFRPAASPEALILGTLLLARSREGDRDHWRRLATDILDAHENTDDPEVIFNVVMLCLATPPKSQREEAIQRRAVIAANRAGRWADDTPSPLNVFPHLVRPNLLLAHALAEYRKGDLESSSSLLRQVDHTAPMMWRAIALAYMATIENHNGHPEAAAQLRREAKQLASDAPPEETNDPGQKLWSRNVLFELALREAENRDLGEKSELPNGVKPKEELDKNAPRFTASQSTFWRIDQPQQFMPLVAAPEQHKLLFENKYVNVYRVTNPPGGIAPPHVHVWPSVLIVDEPASLVLRNQQGEVLSHRTEDEFPLVSFGEPSKAPYSVQNVDDHPIRLWQLKSSSFLGRPNPMVKAHVKNA